MADGRILIIGGKDGNGNALETAEVLNPDGTIAPVPSMLTQRYGHSAILLHDGNLRQIALKYLRHITLQATDQEMLMLSLHLLQVSLVYVNTLMIQQVLKEREWLGRLTAADLRALSPLKWQHINPYGTFALNMKERLPLELVTAYLGATLPDFRPSLVKAYIRVTAASMASLFGNASQTVASVT
jgi:hypothetical protein